MSVRLMTEAYSEGCAAADFGRREECPYPAGSAQARERLIGFDNTVYEAQDRYDPDIHGER